MTNEKYKAALEQAEADMAHAIQERDKWTMELVRLEQLINSLAAMQKSDVRGSLSRYIDDIGFQEVVLTCVRQSPKPVMAMDIRDHLKLIGYDLSKFKNPLAVIHGALKRLAAADKINDVKQGFYSSKAVDELLEAMGLSIGRKSKAPGGRR